jgi:thioredoxin reductase
MLNGYLSRDGIKPAEFLSICQAELVRYETVEVRPVKVCAIERQGKAFTATFEDGGHATARTVLLSSGIKDELPSVNGLEQFFGKTIHTCPYCHGWECKGEPLAVLGGSDAAAELAMELKQWSEDLVLCSNGVPAWSRKADARLASRNVKVMQDPVDAFVGVGQKLSGIRFADRTVLPRKAVFLSPLQKQRTRLAEQLGCKITREGCIGCDETRATRVPGVFTAGNAGRGKQLVIIAAAEGTRAAIAINDLLSEDS